MASISARRLCMELGEINVEGCPAEVLGESLYQRFSRSCDANYPISVAAGRLVVDQTAEAPILPICASILGTERSAVLSVSVVCVTLHSMLACCKSRKVPPHVKERPVHNDRYVRTVPNNLKKVRVLSFQ
ncbi:UBC-like protein [Pisolithus croceorrhizus]|nr:UBC-like protein [Pisolithus croceorrhizus]KAI6104678.1 UBC-like protein [Pisolithus croceorrhizus]